MSYKKYCSLTDCNNPIDMDEMARLDERGRSAEELMMYDYDCEEKNNA